MLKPLWQGKFTVVGPRDHALMRGFPSANAWLCAQAWDAMDFETRVRETFAREGLSVAAAENLEQIPDDNAAHLEVRPLLYEARRQPDLIFCGDLHGFEPTFARRPVMLELRTERLRLRPWLPPDREAFARLNADHDVMNFLGRTMARRESDGLLDRYLANFEQVGFSVLVVESLTDRTFLGVAGLDLMRDLVSGVEQPAVELIIRLHKEHWRKGYAAEAGRRLLALGFHDFLLDHVHAVTSLSNQPALGLLTKIGMRQRPELDFDAPKFPSRHIYRRHTVFTAHAPKPAH